MIFPFIFTLMLEDAIKEQKVLAFCINSVSTNRFFVKETPKTIPSPYGEMRADWFIANVFQPENYYRYLNVKTYKDFKKACFFEENDFKEMAINYHGLVAINHTAIVRYPTITGYWYESRYLKNSTIDSLIKDKYDFKSIITSLPNGLNAYAIVDFKNKLQDHVDIALSSEGKCAINCFSCHQGKLHDFRCAIRDHLKEGLAKTTKKDIIKLFSGEVPLQADNKQFAKALLTLNGLTPEQNAKYFNEIVEKYNAPVDKAKAARELKITVKELDKKLLSIKSSLALSLYSGRKISRKLFEDIYKELK